jgi:AcrR family transcriptional regulator
MREDVLRKAADDPRGTAARILDAAEEVFAEDGYLAASTRRIAKRARVPFGALHYHWGSKKQLWEAVWRRLDERTRETVLRNLVPGRSPGETIDNMVDAFMDVFLKDPNAARLSYRIALERGDLHTRGVRELMEEQGKFGLEILRKALPGVEMDGAAALLILANAFVSAIVDVPGQKALLGASISTSREARERLRAELKRFGRAAFKVTG